METLGNLAFGLGVALTWQNIDLSQREVRYQSRKTRRSIVTPLAQPLLDNLEKLPAGDDPK